MHTQDKEKQFGKLIKEHELLIYKVCSIYTCSYPDKQDLFQEIVIQLWKAFPRFKGDSKFSTWLYRVALNTAITGLRKEKRSITVVNSTASLTQIIEAENCEEERLQQLYTAIEKLNQIEKAIVMLYMEDKTYEEMEDILGISPPTLRVKMTRIKEKLRQLTKINK